MVAGFVQAITKAKGMRIDLDVCIRNFLYYAQHPEKRQKLIEKPDEDEEELDNNLPIPALGHQHGHLSPPPPLSPAAETPVLPNPYPPAPQVFVPHPDLQTTTVQPPQSTSSAASTSSTASTSYDPQDDWFGPLAPDAAAVCSGTGGTDGHALVVLQNVNFNENFLFK